jgi:dolichol kinase
MAFDPIFVDALVKVLVLAYYAIIIVFICIDIRNFKRDAGSWFSENVASNMVLLLVLGFIMLFFVLKLDFTNLEETRPAFIIIPLILALSPPVLLSISAGTSIYHKMKGNSKDLSLLKESVQKREMDKRGKKKLNFHRKLFHFAIFLAIIGVMAIISPFAGSYADPTYFWGDSTGMVLQNYLDKSHPYGVAQGIIIVMFYMMSWLFLVTDTMRLSSHLYFPLGKILQNTLRESEIKSYASYVHFSVGFLFASLLSPPTLLLGIFALFTFGDTMAATIGIRIGKHKIKVNPKKSWEGTIAGFLASFLIAVPFVGWAWGFAGALLFVIVDVFTPTPIPISDNILIPIAIPMLYWGLALMGIPATCYILAVFG